MHPQMRKAENMNTEFNITMSQESSHRIPGFFNLVNSNAVSFLSLLFASKFQTRGAGSEKS